MITCIMMHADLFKNFIAFLGNMTKNNKNFDLLVQSSQSFGREIKKIHLIWPHDFENQVSGKAANCPNTSQLEQKIIQFKIICFLKTLGSGSAGQWWSTPELSRKLHDDDRFWNRFLSGRCSLRDDGQWVRV